MAKAPETSHAARINGPWMPQEVTSKLADMRHDFNMARDPYIARQMQDRGKSEAQIRRENAEAEKQASGQEERSDGGEESRSMVESDQPKPRPAPPLSIGRAVDAQSFGERWLAAHRDAALSRAVLPQQQQEIARERSRDMQEPSR